MTTTRGGDALRAGLHGVYALLDPARVEPLAFAEALLRGGIRLFQIRAKGGMDEPTLVALVERVRAAGGVTIVNDDIRLAQLADGVHLGQEDCATLDLAEVRRDLGARIIGLSCGTPQEAAAADPRFVDYLGVGPVFATASKHDAGHAIGISGVRAVVDATGLPCAAIGGIGTESIARVRESGAAMAAVISALVCDDPQSAARTLVERWG